jgi:hypothetical protein
VAESLADYFEQKRSVRTHITWGMALHSNLNQHVALPGFCQACKLGCFFLRH